MESWICTHIFDNGEGVIPVQCNFWKTEVLEWLSPAEKLVFSSWSLLSFLSIGNKYFSQAIDEFPHHFQHPTLGTWGDTGNGLSSKNLLSILAMIQVFFENTLFAT